MSSVVPPPTLPVADAMTTPGATSRSMIVPAIDGGHASIVEALLRQIDVGLGANQRGVRTAKIEHRGLVLLRRDDFRGEHVVGPLRLQLRDVVLRLRGVEIGLRLVELVLDVAGVDLDEQIARLDHRAGFDRQLGDHARRLRLDLDDVDRLDDARRLRVDDDIAALNGRHLNGGRLVLLAGAGGRGNRPGPLQISVSRIVSWNRPLGGGRLSFIKNTTNWRIVLVDRGWTARVTGPRRCPSAGLPLYRADYCRVPADDGLDLGPGGTVVEPRLNERLPRRVERVLRRRHLEQRRAAEVVPLLLNSQIFLGRLNRKLLNPDPLFGAPEGWRSAGECSAAPKAWHPEAATHCSPL